MQAIIERHIAAINAFQTDAIVETFADDALVYDMQREFRGTAAIRAFVAKELVGDRVTMAVTEIIERGNETVVRARYDGAFDRTNLPPELILTNYITVEADRIKTLIIVRLR